MSWISQTALLLIDVQKNFFSDTQIPISFPLFKENTIELLRKCRENGIEVIHVRADYNLEDSKWLEWWKARNPGKDGLVKVDHEDFVKEEGTEKVVVKHNFDAFMDTDLEQYLKGKGIKNVICAGLVTSCCILFTVNSAFLRGFRTFVMEDCCGDRLVDRHNNIMNGYGHYLFFRVKLDNFLEECRKWGS